MPVRLIINADDYGRSPGISRGIREAHQRGVVTSTSCLMNFPNTASDIALSLKDTPDLGLGVHLVLTTGDPLLPADHIPSLADSAGHFFKLGPLMDRLDTLNPQEVKAEWTAQIDRFIRTSQRRPTHLDSHHHISFFTEDLFHIMLELAADYGCPIRLALDQGDRDMMARLVTAHQPRTADAFYDSFYDQGATKENLLDIIASLKGSGIYEIMCHPGYADQALIGSTTYAHQRERELDILTDSEVSEAVAKRGIELVTFADLG